MYIARDELLAGAALAEYQNRARNRRDARDCVLQLLHRWAAAAQRTVRSGIATQLRHLGEKQPPLDREVDLARHALDGVRFVDERECTELDRLNATIVAAGARIDDH